MQDKDFLVNSQFRPRRNVGVGIICEEGATAEMCWPVDPASLAKWTANEQ